MTDFSLVITGEHEAALRDQVLTTPGVEGACYLLLRRSTIAADPWEHKKRVRLLVRDVVPIPDNERVSADGMHVTWSTSGFVRMMQRARSENLVIGIAHSHPNGPA